jgi:hypothetical protein
MADFLSYLHQFPCGGKYGFISLLLPKVDVEATIRELTLDQSRFPLRFFGNTHLRSSRWLSPSGYQAKAKILVSSE